MKNRPDINSKYRISIVSMNDNGTNSFTGFARKLMKSPKAVAARYAAAGIFTVLSFLFQAQGIRGSIVSTVLAYACIFATLILCVELIIHNSLAGKKLQVAIVVLFMVAVCMLMEQMCTGYPSKAFDYTTMSEYGKPWHIGRLF